MKWKHDQETDNEAQKCLMQSTQKDKYTRRYNLEYMDILKETPMTGHGVEKRLESTQIHVYMKSKQKTAAHTMPNYPWGGKFMRFVFCECSHQAEFSDDFSRLFCFL